MRSLLRHSVMEVELEMDLEILGLVIVAIIVFVILYLRFGNELRERAKVRAERREQFGEEYNRFKDEHNNPYIPDFIEKHPERSFALLIILIVLAVTVVDCFHAVPPGHRGVLVTMGKVEPVNLGEGLQTKLPFVQEIVDMKVTLEKEEVEESTASSDLQEIRTTLTVHFNVMPDHAWRMYQNMQMNYHTLLLKPIIQEDLKATTAQFTAEELIKTRALLVQRLTDKLDSSLTPYGINVQTVNFVNFQFTAGFMDAIEAKVTAEQEALQAKNILVRIQYEAQQKIIQAEADRNATIINADAEAQRLIINANAEAEQKVISAKAEAQRIMLEADATAEAIKVITGQMTDEYARYLWLRQWDGVLPSTLLGNIEDLGIIIDTP